MNKVVELNIEYGQPSTEAAIRKLKDSLMTYKRIGVKIVIVIHGYGSTGTGGSIKAAVKSLMKDNSMRGIIKDFASGEDWYSRKRQMQSYCGSLTPYDQRISGNEGITVIALR